MLGAAAAATVAVVACGAGSSLTADNSPPTTANATEAPLVNTPVPVAPTSTPAPAISTPNVVATAPPPSPPPAAPAGNSGCYIDPEGNCYRAGEFCPNAMHGQTIQGAGGPLTCRDVNGWRWESA